jgi:DNA-binding SARP family transcriptional activator
VDSRVRDDTIRREPDDQTLSIRLLGEFSVSHGERQVEASSWRFHNARRLVQILALTPGHRVHREQVTEWFWPEAGARSASNNFHQIVHHARRALKSIGVDGHALRVEGGLLALSGPEDRLWIDVDAFEAAARAAMSNGSVEAYRIAIELYAGELLPEERYADWAAPRREALNNTYLGLLLRLGKVYEETGDFESAEDAYGRLVGLDQVSEAGHAGLMRIFARTGRRQQALTQFQRLDEALKRELDVSAGPELLDLRESISQGTYAHNQPDPHPRTRTVPGEAPFVSRERELGMLRSAIEHGFSGTGGVLVLSGEPGVGKTRTAREVANYAGRSGSMVLWGNCYQDEGAPPYWPWVQALRDATAGMDPVTMLHLMGHGAADIRQILPEIREHLPPQENSPNPGAEQARFQLFDSLTRFFRQLALRCPLLIVLDDLHWSDHSTLLLLSYMAGETGRSRIVIVGTYRDTETGSDHPLTATLADLGRTSALQRLPLGGLSEADVLRLVDMFANVENRDIDARLVFQRTEGNPFFVGEVLRMLQEDPTLSIEDWANLVPPGVRDVIGQRLSRLSDGCVLVLECASVSGRHFNVNLLEQVAELDRTLVLDALDEAMQSGLIQVTSSGDGSYQFSHALVQETVYTSLPVSRRATLHRRMGAALERLHPAEIDNYLNELAHHYARAAVSGDIAPAVEYGLRAGDRALEQIAYSEAIDHYRRTLAIVEQSTPVAYTDLLEVLLRLGDAQNHIGLRDDARKTFSRAANVSRELELPTEFARAALGYTGLGVFVGPPDNIPLLEEAVAWLPAEDTVLRARVVARLAFETWGSSTRDRRRRLLQEAEGIARRVGDPSTLIYVLITVCLGSDTLDNLDARVAMTAEARDLVEESGEVLLAPTVHAMGVYNGLETGDMRLLDTEIASFDVYARRQRQPQRQWLVLMFKAVRAVTRGYFTEAEQLTEGARELSSSIMPAEYHHARVLNMEIAIARERGRLNRELEEKLEVSIQNDADKLYLRALLAWLRSERRSGAGVESDIEELIAETRRFDSLDADSLAAAALLSRTAHVTGHTSLARTLYEIIEPYRRYNVVTRDKGRHWYGPATFFTGCLAASLGCLDVAVQDLEAALEVNQRMQARPCLARNQYELARVLRRRGKPGDHEWSRQLLDAAREIAFDVGMPVLVEEINAEVCIR